MDRNPVAFICSEFLDYIRRHFYGYCNIIHAKCGDMNQCRNKQAQISIIFSFFNLLFSFQRINYLCVQPVIFLNKKNREVLEVINFYLIRS